MAKVSIIVPVYNVERYLAKCLDSCINQTFDDIEIICVNDGSTDRSLSVLEAYARLDDRIKIIAKENGGLSSARNTGVKVAGGDYILYVDSDDFISQIAVESSYKNAVENNSDVVLFDYFLDVPNPQFRNVLTINAYGDKYVNSPFNIDNIENTVYKYTPIAAWTKLYKREFLEKNNIVFKEGVYYEDVPYWAEVLIKANRITYLNQPLYSYFVGRDGQIMACNDKRCFDVITVFQDVEKYFKECGYYERFKPVLDVVMIMHFIQKLKIIRVDLREKLFNAYRKLNTNIDYELYKNLGTQGFECSAVENFELLNNVETFEDFVNLQKGVFNDK